MKKSFVLSLVSVVMLSGCGESEQEKANYEAIESEAKDFSRPGGPGTLDDGTEAERERQRKLKDEQKAADEAAAAAHAEAEAARVPTTLQFEEGCKKSHRLSLFCFFFTPGSGNDKTGSAGAYFGQVLMYTEPQKKSETKILFFRGEISL